MGSSTQSAYIQVAHARVRHITEALEGEGACVVITGDHGGGKAYLAQSAAQEFERAAQGTVTRFVINSLEELDELNDGSPLPHPQQEGARILRLLDMRAGGKDILLVALGVDRYPADDAATLEFLVRARQVRLICTAHQITGAADRLARNPSVHQIVVPPFTIDESGAFLAKLFEVDLIAQETLTNWHTASAGNQHALVTIALSAERRGVLQRARRVAWVSRNDDVAPADFITQLRGLSAEEREALELVAFAEPLYEPALLHLLNAPALESLLDRLILSIQHDASGASALVTRLPVVGAAFRAHLSPLRKAELATACFEALGSDDISKTLSSKTRLRLVRFGVEGGCDVPVDWVWQAMKVSVSSPDLRFALALALRGMTHDNSQRAAEAILLACD